MEFGEDHHEFIIESYNKIPWLIWIQLLIMILLVLLLFFGLTVFTPDTAVASSSSNGLNFIARPPPTHLNNPMITSSSEITEVEDRRDRIHVEASGVSTREEDRTGDENLSLNDHVLCRRTSQQPNHPCNYFRLAKCALLKCLGLDSSSESSSNSRHEKEE